MKNFNRAGFPPLLPSMIINKITPALLDTEARGEQNKQADGIRPAGAEGGYEPSHARSDQNRLVGLIARQNPIDMIELTGECHLSECGNVQIRNVQFHTTLGKPFLEETGFLRGRSRCKSVQIDKTHCY